MERRRYIRGKKPRGHQQATLPWPGYLDTGLGQQTEPLSEVQESLAMSPINSMPPSLYLLSASIYIFVLFFMIQFCSINSIVFCTFLMVQVQIKKSAISLTAWSNPRNYISQLEKGKLVT